MIKRHSFLFNGAALGIFILLAASCGSRSASRRMSDEEFKPALTQDAGLTEQERLESEIVKLQQDLSDVKSRMAQRDDQITDRIHELNRRIKILETKTTAASSKRPYRVKENNPEVLYKKARNLLLEGDLKQAAAHFSSFIIHHPDNNLADNATYWLGECHYSGGNFQQAILVFKDLVKTYPKSDKIPDALLKTGYSYLSLDDTNRAHHFLKLVIKRYPFSPACEKAQEKLKGFE